MSHATPEGRFRRAAEAEGGSPVSAGARVAHVRAAVTFVADLSAVPQQERPALVARIKELVRQASTAALRGALAPDTTGAAG
jgi:hypothetical protein